MASTGERRASRQKKRAEAGRSCLVRKAARIGGIQTTIIRNLLQHAEETHKCLWLSSRFLRQPSNDPVKGLFSDWAQSKRDRETNKGLFRLVVSFEFLSYLFQAWICLSTRYSIVVRKLNDIIENFFVDRRKSFENKQERCSFVNQSNRFNDFNNFPETKINEIQTQLS